MSTQDTVLKLLCRLSSPIREGPPDPDQVTMPGVTVFAPLGERPRWQVIVGSDLRAGKHYVGSRVRIRRRIVLIRFSWRVAGLLSDTNTRKNVHVRDKLFAICDDVHEHHASTASIPGIGVAVAKDGLSNDLSWDELVMHNTLILSIDSLVGNCLPMYKKNRQRWLLSI
jgi:hypothetical protein